MPVYNEAPDVVFETLRVMARGLIRSGAGASFDIFVLSDTRSDLIAHQEERCFERLRAELGPAMAVYYRGAKTIITRRPAMSRIS